MSFEKPTDRDAHIGSAVRPSGASTPRARPLQVPRPSSGSVRVIGFDHVDLRVGHRGPLRDFFVKVLAMDPIGEERDHTFLLFGDQVLGLRDGRKRASFRALDHIAFRLPRTATRADLVRRLRRAGVRVSGTRVREDSWSIFLFGPEGLRIELVHRPHPQSHPVHSMEARGSDGRSRSPSRG